MSVAGDDTEPPLIRRMEKVEHDLQLFKQAFDTDGSPRDLVHLRWQYELTPVGKLLVLFAMPLAGDHVAAIYATVPLSMKARDRTVLGAQSLDTLTGHAYRGKGLFAQLASQMFEAVAPAESVSCVFGFPNKNSAHGFFGRLGWTRLDPVPFMLRPLRTGYIARRILGSACSRFVPDITLTRGQSPRLGAEQNWREIHEFDAEFDALWLLFSKGIGFSVVRDSKYLNWRLRRPGSRYQTRALYESGKLLGFVTTSLEVSREAGGHGHVVELIYDPDRPVVGKLLLQAAVQQLYQAGADVALAWNLPGSPNRGAFVRAGFMPVPRRFQPIELHFGVRWLDGAAPEGISDRRRWYVSYLDCDTN
jgi:hypothetical protein